MPEITTPKTAPANTKKLLSFNQFTGVDLTSGMLNVDPWRSPDAPNMMPDEDGFPKKRYGYQTVKNYGAPVYAAHRFSKDGQERLLVHAGNKLYDLAGGDDPVFEGMAEVHSTAVQLGGKLWILDGQNYLYYDGQTCAPVSEIATVPMITIAKDPAGVKGAESYKPVNLLTGWRTDSYLGNATAKVYVLSFGDLSAAAVKCEKLDSGGNWVEIAASGYTVDRTAGKVTFTTAPGASPVEGTDNVHITYEVASNKADVINGCRHCILYGVNGALDRVFVTGNPAEPNIDYWSDYNDPAYMGDSFYGQLGQEGSPIIGYSVLNNTLVAHKQGEENDRNVFVRSGELDDEGFALFKIDGVMQGEGAISPRAFGSLSGEPMFLTRKGIYALTSGNVTGERYVQGRSYFLRTGLQKEKDLANACAVNFGRFYMLAVGGRMYLLDGEQAVYNKNEPHSTHQYEGYYWENISAECLFVHEDRLYFGTRDGRVCKFYSDEEPGYNDDGAAVEAYWTIPLQNMDRYGRLKTVTGVWVVGQPFNHSGGDVYFISDQNDEVYVGSYEVDCFSFDDIDLSQFTFDTLNRPAIVPVNKKAKKVKLFAVKLRNGEQYETFGLQGLEIEYREGSRVKR